MAFKLKVMEELRDGKWKLVSGAVTPYGISYNSVSLDEGSWLRTFKARMISERAVTKKVFVRHPLRTKESRDNNRNKQIRQFNIIGYDLRYDLITEEVLAALKIASKKTRAQSQADSSFRPRVPIYVA